MTDELTFVVDRIEGRRAVLISDDESEVVLPIRQLPSGIGEGTVLRVSTRDNAPDWPTARVDAEEQARRLDAVRRKMDELRSRDPGGDLEL